MKNNTKNRLDRFKDVLLRIYTSGSTVQIDMETERKLVFLKVLAIFAFISCTIYIVITYAKGDYWNTLLNLTFVILVAIMFFYIQRTRDPVLPCYLITIFSGVFLLFLVAHGVVDNLGSLWSYGYPMIVLFLLGNKKGTKVLSIYLICVRLTGQNIPSNRF